MLELKGRGAIIVGARRVGQTVVERLAREGVRPAIVYRRSRDEAESLQRQVAPLVDRSCVVQADLTVEEDVQRAVATAKQELGDLSFAINLASDYPYHPFEELNAEAWERGMSAARGAYLFALHAARAMQENQGPTRGHIVMFGDWAAAETPYTGYLPYLTAKASIHFMTRAFALELAGSGILVNAISPGPTAKPPDMTDAAWQSVVNRAPLRRESSDEEMAELICTLLKLETVTGQNIRVDSGKSLSGNCRRVITFVVNLKRRPDRRRRMESVLPPELQPHYTTDWDGPTDGAGIDESVLEGYGLFPTWQIESDNPFWSRPLKRGEIGCAVSHWLCWQRSIESDDDLFLCLEDDVELAEGFMERLQDGLARLSAHDPAWDLLYLGRHPKAPDTPAIDGIVRPGYSWCSYAYMLSRSGVEKVVATGFNRDLMPVDEFLPALYVDHERQDIRRRYPKVLNAYAFEPPLVRDLPRDIWGTDTEDSADIR